MRKKLGCLIIGLMVLVCAACGKKTEGTDAASMEYVYRTEEIALEELSGDEPMDILEVTENRIYMQRYQSAENTRTLTLLSQKPDGSDKKKIELAVGEDAAYSWIMPTEDGGYYMVYEEYIEDNSDPDNYIWRTDYCLIKLDGEGREIFRKPLTGMEGEEYWLQWLQLLPDGKLVISDSLGTAIYDGQGERLSEVKLDKEQSISNAVLLSDGTLLCSMYDSEQNRMVMSKLKEQTGELEGEYLLPGGADGYSLYPGKGSDLLLVGSSGVFAYNLGDTELKKLMDFVDSDLATNYIYHLAAISETEFYGVMEDESWETLLLKFIKVNPDEIADKQVLSLACVNLDWDMRKRVVEFNKTSEKYRIRIEDYSQYNTNEDYTAGAARLNTDIASGKVPDILLGDWQIPLESYTAKGLFEDLYPYIDKDTEFSREDFFQNVMQAYEVSGSLYRLVPKFAIHTVVGKTADVGEVSGWTLEELNQLMASKPENMEIFPEQTRLEMLNYSMQMTGEEFIDWESGSCRFNTEEFIRLLEFVGQFPEKLPEDYFSDDYWMSYDSMWRDNRALLAIMYLNNFYNYNYMKKATFGEDITLIGFPTGEGNGSVIDGHLELMMSSKSENKEGAWEFMRYFLTDEYQSGIADELPLSKKQADRLAKEAQKKPVYEDENGNMVEYDPTYVIGNVEMPLEMLTEEEAAEVMDFIQSVNRIYSYNEKLNRIVEEEAAAYFSGQKSAKETAEIIQSRVQIYVNENR